MIGGDVGINSAWAFIESWALTPGLNAVVSDRAKWQIFDDEVEGGGEWLQDSDFTADCVGTDNMVYVR